MTTFISYSRVNSEFVVRLARDLKAAGYDVWLDQLDIPKGARWDDAIEAAVERSSTFMIVLAPESIESQNVKDELSYAIDSGKRILPVVIRPCKIPLRLRRFQHVDFTDKPYKESLADIKRLLSNTQRISKDPTEESLKSIAEEPVYETVDAPPIRPRHHGPPELTSPPPSFREEEPKTQPQLQKFVIPALAVLVLVAAAGAAMFALNRNEPALPTTSPTLSATPTPAPPTSTFTSTPIPIPLEVPDEHGVTMRLVNASDFIMGGAGIEDEQQAQTLFLDLFYIDKYEVTNQQYRRCVQDGACLPPKKANSATRVGYFNRPEFNSFPVVNVDWSMARSYCEWRGARLPTEAEWEKAARGPEGNTYPWGEEINCDRANYSGCQTDTVSVSSFGNGVSEYGIYNMAGNVSEWVSSLYLPYPYDLFDGREDLESPGERVVRGGSWLNSASQEETRSAYRQKADPAAAKENIGFRCARTPNAAFGDYAFSVEAPLNASTATAAVATNRSHRTQEARTATVAARTPTIGSPTNQPKTPTVGPSETKPIGTITQPSPIVTDTEPPVIATDTEPPPIPTDTERPPEPTDTPSCTGYC